MKNNLATGRIIAGKTYYWENWNKRHIEARFKYGVFVWGDDNAGYYPNLDEYQLLDAPMKLYQN